MSDDLDKILDELKQDDSISSLGEPPSAEKIDISDDNVNEYVMQKVARLVESGIDTVEAIQQSIASGFEPEELQAFSGLLASVTKAADTLNKINIQNKKDKASKELKQMDLEGKQKQLNSGGGTTNNVLIATREEVIERFLEKNDKVINTEAEVVDEIDKSEEDDE